MAKNDKAHENEIAQNPKKNDSEAAAAPDSLTEDELLEQFAKVIIDIYFDQLNEKENLQQPTSRSA
mgnify:FL=1|jgi:hypothetical protein